MGEIATNSLALTLEQLGKMLKSPFEKYSPKALIRYNKFKNDSMHSD